VSCTFELSCGQVTAWQPGISEPAAQVTANMDHGMDRANPMKIEDHSSASDEQLVKAAQKDDMDAFEELVARHRDKIYARAFMMMRNEDEAIDLSQEAWVKSWQRLKQFQGESSFTSWLTRIVINVCLDRLRWRKRHRTESIEEMDEESGGIESRLPMDTVNPADRLERNELRMKIDHALAQLSVEQRTVLVLHEFEDLEYREIARVMDCSIGTVMSRLFYARRKMALLLADVRIEEIK
jgi:RNA polymerase sigma-70 factor, ECF subfamily